MGRIIAEMETTVNAEMEIYLETSFPGPKMSPAEISTVAGLAIS
jgi:hypothetical protein